MPKVSVCMITYNHATHIGEALDSILMQKVNFDYEIVVGDDCSTDDTRLVIQKYCERHPGIIRPLLRPTNIGMQRNAKQTLESCQGQYVAFLEGDDYWTDPQKLQLQADYLDTHEDCSLCHHSVAHVRWPSGQKISTHPSPKFRVERPNPDDLALVNFIQTCSVVFRRKWLPDLDGRFQELKLGDWPLFVLLSERGWIGFIDREMAHYRIHGGNNWNSRPAESKVQAMQSMAEYLLSTVRDDRKHLWKDTILALALKDLFLSLRRHQFRTAIKKAVSFARKSIGFKKPFWLFNRLPRYLYANYASGN